MQGLWPHIRAVLIVVHLVAIAIKAFPAPGGGMKRGAWKDPTVQAEFDAWRGRLSVVGVDVSAEEFEERLWQFATGYNNGVKSLTGPFDPYYRYCGTWQSWRMFVAPHRHPARLHIDVETAGEWQPIYVGRSEVHEWHREQFDHDRFRSAHFRYAWGPYASTFKQFGVWVAKEAAVDFPEARRVRLRYFKYRTPSPLEVREDIAAEGHWQRALTHDLAKYR
jgi:hypothetical protein